MVEKLDNATINMAAIGVEALKHLFLLPVPVLEREDAEFVVVGHEFLLILVFIEVDKLTAINLLDNPILIDF